MNYTTHFHNSDVGQVKATFRRLLFKVHPDRHPESEAERWNRETRDLIEAYHQALRAQDGTVYTGTDNRDHTYKYDEATENDLIEAVARTIRAKLPERATVTIVGLWVWVEGLTRTDKDAHKTLKGEGEEVEGKRPPDVFRFHSKRQAWYWRPAWSRARYNPDKSLSELKRYYGARVVEKEEDAAPLAC